jgi:hypothetical protein
MTPSGIEAATFPFVAQHFNHCVAPVQNNVVFRFEWRCLRNKVVSSMQFSPEEGTSFLIAEELYRMVPACLNPLKEFKRIFMANCGLKS